MESSRKLRTGNTLGDTVKMFQFTSASALIHSHEQYIGDLYGPNNNLDQALTFYLPCQEYDNC